MTIYRVTPPQGVPYLGQFRNLEGAQKAAARDHPGGAPAAVAEVPVKELEKLAAAGAVLPIAGRRAVEARRKELERLRKRRCATKAKAKRCGTAGRGAGKVARVVALEATQDPADPPW